MSVLLNDWIVQIDEVIICERLDEWREVLIAGGFHREFQRWGGEIIVPGSQHLQSLGKVGDEKS